MIDLVCLGNVTIDDIVLPDGTTSMASFGGNTIYASLAASYWSDHVRLVAPIGIDYPDTHMKKLREVGWDLSGMPLRNIPTTRNWVVYEYDGRRTWIIRSNPEHFHDLSPLPHDIPESFLRAKSFLIMGMELSAEESLAPFLKSLGSVVCFDPQEDNMIGNQDRVFRLLKSVDIFLPSQVEVHRLLGHNDYECAAREFVKQGPKIVVIKMGGQGSLIYDSEQDQFIQIPIYPTEVKDTTGAGDSFCGGFMAMYIKTNDLRKAGLAGAVSASFAIEGLGITDIFNVTRQDAETRLNTMLFQSYNQL